MILLNPPIADNSIVVVLTASPVRQIVRETAMVIVTVDARVIASLVLIARVFLDVVQDSKAKAVIVASAATRVVVDHAPEGNNTQDHFFVTITRRDSTSCRVMLSS